MTHLTYPERARRRLLLIAQLLELEHCPACREGPYCAEHPKALLQELLHEVLVLDCAGP